MPVFSIVVPTFNAEATLAETLEAVAGQEYSDWECIVVDDGSVDRTAALAESYSARDSRFRVMSQKNQGTAGAYNTGVRTSKGRLVVICSADDLLLPNHLTEMAGFIERNPDFEIYSSNGEYLFDKGERKVVYRDPEWKAVRSLTMQEVLACCFFSVGATFRREVFDLVGGYREAVYGEDYDFWLRALARGARHLYLPRVLSLHRISSHQKSADLVGVYESNIEVYENLIDDGWVRPEQVPMVRAAIDARRQLIATVSQETVPAGRADKLVASLKPWLGARLASGVVGIAQRVRHSLRSVTGRPGAPWRK